MSNLRRDHLHDTWTIAAPGRGDRPRDIRLQSVPVDEMTCPFCPGNETETPPEILVTGRPEGAAPDQPPWRVRVVPNRYPAVTGASGRHEVVIVSPDHRRELADLTPPEATELLAAVRDRYRQLEQDPDLAATLFFLNSGAGAGASLTHPHGQILATPITPALLRTELGAFERWRTEHGRCLLCDAVAVADDDQRLVVSGDHAVAVTPHASRFSWETMILPRRHQARITDAHDHELAAVAVVLVDACRALRAAAADPAYNLVLHSAPPAGEDFHWHLELLPRLAPLAGFETGTGFHINPVLPEAAARDLRRAIADPSEGSA